jgi:beta-lactam-binding protein with PASTA domain
VFKFITDKPLWVNIVAGLSIVLILILLFFGSLDWLTNYGKSEKVPSVLGVQVAAAQKMLEDKGFDVVIQDSVFVDTAAKESVIRQTPDADEVVKQGRTIYLTINRVVPPQIEIPNLAGFSIKSAEMYLQSLGLKLGAVSYKPDIAKNAVLEMLMNGTTVQPGTRVPLGSMIGFVLGSGVGDSEIDVPYIVGKTLNDARAYLSTLNINIGSVLVIGSVNDSGSAYIVKQIPELSSSVLDTNGKKQPNKIRSGQLMDVYISETAPTTVDTSLNISQ